MRAVVRLVLAVLSIAVVAGQARDTVERSPDADFRVLSWNVSRRSFIEQAARVRDVLRLVDPDILLLDEIPTNATERHVLDVVRGLRGAGDTTWSIVIGRGGWDQRGVIAARAQLSGIFETNEILPYPDTALSALKNLVPAGEWERVRADLDAGVAVAGSTIRLGTRTLLAITLDLQCCKASPDWQEERRVVEAQLIRGALQRALRRVNADAVLLAGDFNTVSSAAPLAVLTNPYPPPHFALVPVEATQLDGRERWTWDGRGSEFPSGVLDYSLHTAATLMPVKSFIFSTEDLDARTLAEHRLDAGTSRRISDHLPVVVDYRWRN